MDRDDVPPLHLRSYPDVGAQRNCDDRQRSALVQGRDHLRAARPRLPRQRRRRHRRFRRPDRRSSTTSRTSASPPSGCLPFYPSPLKDDGYDIADYTDIHPQYGNAARLQGVPRRRPRPRPARHHRAGHQPHLRSAPLVPARPPRRPAAPSATSTSGATRPSSTRKRASSSRTSSRPTGPGTPSPRPTTGTASTATSPT